MSIFKNKQIVLVGFFWRLRKKGGKNGAVFGHKGTNLKQIDTPEEKRILDKCQVEYRNIIDIEYNINNCKKCGFDISEVLAKLHEKRQVQDLDLQETNKKITQYQSYSKECPQCGYENHDNSYPNFVAPHVSYGKNIMAIVVYLNVVHYVSYKRIVQTLKTMYKLKIRSFLCTFMIYIARHSLLFSTTTFGALERERKYLRCLFELTIHRLPEEIIRPASVFHEMS